MSTIEALHNQHIRLLQIFNAESLGDGDLVAGTNVLVSMCASLANLYPPGSCLITPDGNRLDVGLSFVSAGGLTNSLISEKVLNPIATVQNNLGKHLAAHAADSAAKLASTSPNVQETERPMSFEASSAVVGIQNDMDWMMNPRPRDSSPFRRLLGPCQSQGLGNIANAPAVFLNADSAEGLQRELAQAHRHYPYVRAALTAERGMERLKSQLQSVVCGTSLPNGVAGPVHVRGHVAASCAPGLLAQSVAPGEDTLLAQMIWLVDGQSELITLQQADPELPTPYVIHTRYRESMERAWAHRLDYRNETREMSFDWQEMQFKWVKFLQKLEPRCPGIIQAARPLAGTMLFGCLELSEPKKPLGWSLAGVLTVSRLIVERMVNHRERLLVAEQEARLVALAIKLVEKLQGGPLSARALTRKKSKLRIGDCRRVLDLFDRLGIARRVEGDEWKLVLPAERAVERLKVPYIDV